MPENPARFDSAREKHQYVNAMFARIAGHYDRMNRLMSLGRDQAWRCRALELAAVPPGGRLLDLATGTGDLALLSQARDPSVRVVAADFTVEMMQIGRRKESGRASRPVQCVSRPVQRASRPVQRAIDWVGSDALRLPYTDGAFDAVVSGFMMRNVTDITATLAEQRRVARRGGRVVCLEITQPTAPLWRDLYQWIFGRLMPAVTGLLSGQPEAYRYLPASVFNFVDAETLKGMMESVGLRGVGYQKLMLGTVAIHVGVK